VWVPTEFNRKTFTEAGVDPRKLRVVEEGEGARAAAATGWRACGSPRVRPACKGIAGERWRARNLRSAGRRRSGCAHRMPTSLG
jgi:hypothetical protein